MNTDGDGGWQRVNRGTRRCASRRHLKHTGRAEWIPLQRRDALYTTVEGVQDLEANLEASRFFQITWKHLCAWLRTKGEARHAAHGVLCCYGLGSSGDEVFAVQLACASLLRRKLGVDPLRTWVSDPLMQNSDDFNLVRGLQLVPDTTMSPSSSFVTLPAEIRDRLSHDPKVVVVLLMPHCDIPVYGAVFEFIASLNPELLSRCIVLGNDLTQYDHFRVAALYRDNADLPDAYAKATIRLRQLIEEKPLQHTGPLPVLGTCPRAFSDQVLSWFEDNDVNVASQTEDTRER